MKKMRPLRNGGYSMCSCPDELVGKGRCQHVLGIAQVIYDDKDKHIKIVNMDGLDISDSDKTSSEQIHEMLSKIQSLSSEKVEKLMNYFNSLQL